MSHKRPLSLSPSPSPNPTPPSKSSPIKDRASTFIAAFSPTASAHSLQSLPEFSTATHRVAAWRRCSSQRQLGSGNGRGLFETGHDDDGETHGGKAVEGVLREMGVEGCVVVARWFGGVMLGPVRFDHIRGCAREAVERGRVGGGEDDRGGKRVRGEGREEKVGEVEREGERERLVGVLEERDQSVSVLRGLLAEKKRELEGGGGEEGGEVVASPAKGSNYATMELGVLMRLEQVRDKTIGWILGQIEEVEKALLQKSETLLSEAKGRGKSTPGESETLSVEKDDNASKRESSVPGSEPPETTKEVEEDNT